MGSNFQGLVLVEEIFLGATIEKLFQVAGKNLSLQKLQ
jgi:hypothetical protein